MLIFAVAMWALNHYYPILTIIPEPWNWLGWCVIAIAPVAPIAAIIQFRRAHTTVNPHRPETTTTYYLRRVCVDAQSHVPWPVDPASRLGH